MSYIRKVCPICREEFYVLDNVVEKAEFCNFKCFLESIDRMNEGMNEINSIEPF